MHLNYTKLNGHYEIICPYCSKLFFQFQGDDNFEKFDSHIYKMSIEYSSISCDVPEYNCGVWFDTDLLSILHYCKCDSCNNFYYFLILESISSDTVFDELTPGEPEPYQSRFGDKSNYIYIVNPSDFDSNIIIPYEWVSSELVNKSYHSQSHVLGPLKCDDLSEYISKNTIGDALDETPIMPNALLLTNLIRGYVKELVGLNRNKYEKEHRFYYYLLTHKKNVSNCQNIVLKSEHTPEELDGFLHSIRHLTAEYWESNFDNFTCSNVTTLLVKYYDFFLVDSDNKDMLSVDYSRLNYECYFNLSDYEHPCGVTYDHSCCPPIVQCVADALKYVDIFWNHTN